MNPILIANLLSVLIPLGMRTYVEIQQAHTGDLKPIGDVLASADANWDTIIANAQAELAKLAKSANPGV